MSEQGSDFEGFDSDGDDDIMEFMDEDQTPPGVRREPYIALATINNGAPTKRSAEEVYLDKNIATLLRGK